MGHQGSTDDKIKAIELIDDLVIDPVAEGLEQAGEDYQDADSSGSSDACARAYSYR